jgi:hypothetical protein
MPAPKDKECQLIAKAKADSNCVDRKSPEKSLSRQRYLVNLGKNRLGFPSKLTN